MYKQFKVRNLNGGSFLCTTCTTAFKNSAKFQINYSLTKVLFRYYTWGTVKFFHLFYIRNI